MSTGDTAIPTLEAYLVNNGIDKEFDFLEVANDNTHNLLIKPKDVKDKKWLKVLVTNADKSHENTFSVTLSVAPVDVVIVVVYRSETDASIVEFANLFQENDFPLNMPVFLHLPAFDIQSIVERLQAYYSSTPLLEHAT